MYAHQLNNNVKRNPLTLPYGLIVILTTKALNAAHAQCVSRDRGFDFPLKFPVDFVDLPRAECTVLTAPSVREHKPAKMSVMWWFVCLSAESLLLVFFALTPCSVQCFLSVYGKKLHRGLGSGFKPTTSCLLLLTSLNLSTTELAR